MAKSSETPLGAIGDATERLESIRRAIAPLSEEYRAIFARVLRAVADELSPQNGSLPTEPSGESAVERVTSFFHGRANRPATLAEISKATGVNQLSMRSFVYDRHRKKFARSGASGRATLWRLAEYPPAEEQGKKKS
jgi:hypothetical protein